MLLIAGPLFSGKREYARSRGYSDADIVSDAQELVKAHEDLERLANELAQKPAIGDPDRPPEPKDTLRTNRMPDVSGLPGLVLFGALRVLIGVVL